ncbi:MAG: hypothetical protein JHC33_03725 [Ignisphaera sp.]|nr:hypothetical protein [Ignisphaera sp.]
MSYNPTPFKPDMKYSGQVKTELNLANTNFTILGQVFVNNDPSQPVLRSVYINQTAPQSPVADMLWYDTSTNLLKLYDGNNWLAINDLTTINNSITSLNSQVNTVNNSITSLNSQVNTINSAFFDNNPSHTILRATYIGSSAPTNPVSGTTWLDTSTSTPTLKVYDGSNWQAMSGSNSGNATTLNGYSASQTPSANTIPVSLNTGKLDDGWLSFVANDPKVKTSLNASGDAPIYACRAWVNFDGTSNPPTIRASGNVSSITKNGTGDYTVNFTVALPDANYTVHLVNVDSIGGTWTAKVLGSSGTAYPTTYTTSAVRIGFGGGGSSSGDLKVFAVSVFR